MMLTPIPHEDRNPQTLADLQQCHIQWLRAIASGDSVLTFKLSHEDTARLLLEALTRLGGWDHDGSPSRPQEDDYALTFALRSALDASKQLGGAVVHRSNGERYDLWLDEAVWHLRRALWLAESLDPDLKPVHVLRPEVTGE